ncbi:MAG: glycosyltransferase family 2 protein [Muribaculaceae bacterium]|nr:glycosyltransferase family 2 protein [Muribaculaceae bacterium]
MSTSGNVAVSVIVPMYNSEQYIERCAISLFNQTLDDMEIVFVDDCSTDGTVKIVEHLMSSSLVGAKSVRLVRNVANVGSSESRNVGISSSCGEYIGFCDSDDWVEPDMYATMLHCAVSEDADIVGCGMVYEDGDTRRVLRYCYDREHRPDLWRIHNVYSSLCNKLIRRSLYMAHDIKSLKGLSMWDDNAVSFRLRYYSHNTIVVDKTFYHYFNNQKSIVHGTAVKLASDQVSCVKYLEKEMSGEFDTSMFLYDIFEYLKLESKRIYLENRHVRSSKMWRSVFPETNGRGWRNDKFTRRVRMKMAVANYLPTVLADRLLSGVEWCTDRLRK